MATVRQNVTILNLQSSYLAILTTENVNAPVLFICADYGEHFRTARLSLSLL
jgi:hypothetical protein